MKGVENFYTNLMSGLLQPYSPKHAYIGQLIVMSIYTPTTQLQVNAFSRMRTRYVVFGYEVISTDDTAAATVFARIIILHRYTS